MKQLRRKSIQALAQSGEDPRSIYADVPRETYLDPGATRDSFRKVHPLTKNSVIIPTPPMTETYEVVHDFITCHRPGLFFIGDSTVGKTTAINAIIEVLPQSFDNLPVLFFCANNHDAPTERQLYRDMLRNIHHASSETGSASQLRYRLMQYCLAFANNLNSDRIILFVDEAQNYSEPDLTRLRDMSNELRINGLQLLTIFFGTSQLQFHAQSLRGHGRDDLLGRFLKYAHTFRGLRTRNEFRQTLAQYDDHEVFEYPSRSGIGITEFFMPHQFRSGWRLAQEHDQCYEAFLAGGADNSASQYVAMQQFSESVRNFLFYEWGTTEITAELSSDVWAQCVRRSRYGQ